MSDASPPSGNSQTTTHRIIVVAGGNSAERQISLQSGERCLLSLRDAGYDVQILDPASTPLRDHPWRSSDVALLALHGTYGEDGGAQRELKSLGVRYTGSGPAASRKAFDKLVAKQAFHAAQLPTPDYLRWTARTSFAWAIQRLGLPLVVKPVAQGSSLGVSLANTERELDAAITEAQRFPGGVFLERAIPGEEWTVAVLNDLPLPPIRIATAHEFFDFSAKYQNGGAWCEPFPQFDHPTAQRLAPLAVAASRALGCRGLCRVDFRVDPCGQPWILEVNTLPGLTSHSLAPLAAQARGWSMSRLCEEMIRAA